MGVNTFSRGDRNCLSTSGTVNPGTYTQIPKPRGTGLGQGLFLWCLRTRLLPVLPVERPVLHGFGNVLGLDLVAPAQVGDGAGDL